MRRFAAPLLALALLASLITLDPVTVWAVADEGADTADEDATDETADETADDALDEGDGSETSEQSGSAGDDGTEPAGAEGADDVGTGDTGDAETSGDGAASGDGTVAPLDDGGTVAPLNTSNPVSLNTKTVQPASSAAEPLRPGDEIVYTINYDCSALATGGNCNGATMRDRLPVLQDVNGDQIQIEFVRIETLTPNHWTFNGESGSNPNAELTWDANTLGAGATGAMNIFMRIPHGVIPSLETPQQFTNTAEADFPDLPTSSVTSSPSFVNATAPSSTLSKAGPSTALLNATGTGSINHDIRICPAAASVLWEDYEVTDTLPPGATIVTDPLPFGGVFTAPGPDDDHGGTIDWSLTPDNRPDADGQGCLVLSLQVEYVNAINGGHESNVVGEQKTNTVEATGSGELGSQGIGPATTTLTLTGPQTRFGPSKSAFDGTDSRGTFYVQDGETIVYRLGASNTSDAEAVPFTTATLTDGPLPTEFTLTEIRTGSWTGAVADVAAAIEVSTDSTNGIDGTWTQLSAAPNQSVTEDLAGVRWVRWVFSSTGEPAIGPGWNTNGLRLVGDLAGDPDPDPLDLQNCAQVSGVQGGQTQNRGSSCADLLLEGAQPHPSIAKSAPSELEPGGTITYTLTVGNNIDATGPLTDLRVTDCVPDADHLVVHDIVTGAAWTGGIDLAGCTPVAGPPNNGTTGTLLVFDYTGPALQPGESAPALTYDVTANGFQTPDPTSEPTPPGVRRNLVRVSEPDGSDFNHCVQNNCQAMANTTVPFRAQLESQKLVRGTLDSHFNAAGTTTPGGQATWRVQVENRGNVEVDDVQLIDVFPHVGDVGVRLIEQSRGSEYAPRLVDPIDTPGWTVEYSRSSNPCRDEVLRPGDIPHTGCDDPQWTQTPDLRDLPSYRSIRMTLDDRLPIGSVATFEWDMATPVNHPSYAEGGDPTGRLDDCTIPLSTPPFPANPGASELDREQSATPTCPVAVNSFAYGVNVPPDQLSGLPDPGRLGAEPSQVALHVAQPATGHLLGDRVWYDTDNDGIQGPGEAGVPGVPVELYDAADPDDLVWVATTFTDADGIYLFDNLPDGQYVVRFYLPDDIAYVSPQNQDGVSGDRGPEDNSNRDSDVPQDPSGSNALGNFYDTVVITLGDNVDGGWREVDLTWDAGIWVPDPSIAIDKVTKDTAWPDSAADDGVEIVQGRPVTWIYTVTNTGNTYLSGVDVTDVVTTPAAGVDPPDDIVCDWAGSTDPATPAQVLAPGEVVECRASGVAIADDYVNDATVIGTPAQFPREDGGETVYEDIDKVGVPGEVTDNDPSSYHGLTVEIALDKQTAGRLYDLTTGQLVDVGPGDGITVTAGLGVTWIYTIVNTGTAPLGNVTLTDDGGTPADPTDDMTVRVGSGHLDVHGIAADQVAIAGDVRGDGILRPGETWTIEIQDVAEFGSYANDAVVEGEAVDEEDGDPLTPPGDPNGRASDDDPSDYEGVAGPAISLEKATNGYDADQPTGPYVLAGDEVVWTFEVTNTGSVPLLDAVVSDPDLGGAICTIPLLVPGASDTCQVVGERFGSGQQRNDAEVAGMPAETSVPPHDPADPDDWSSDPDDYTPFPDAAPVTDEDPSHHYGADPGIVLEKATNDEDADTPDLAVPVGPGQPVTWTFVVTNTGNTTLDGILVTDIVLGADGQPAGGPVVVTCPSSTLLPGEDMSCTLDGTAGDEAHANLGTVTGQPVDPSGDPVGDEVEDDDPSHYRIGVADLGLTKEAIDAAVPGEAMRWLLVISNAGPDPAPSGTTVTDLLPAELGYLGASDDWACTTSTDDGRQLVECVLDEPIPAGGTAELILTTQVATDESGMITNAASVHGVFADPDPDNDASAGEVMVVGAAGAETPPERRIPGTSLPLPRTGASILLLLAAGMASIIGGTALRRRRA